MPREQEVAMQSVPTQRTNIRCGTCDRLLAKAVLIAGEIEIKCPRCKTCHILRASRPNLAPHDGLLGDRHACTQKPQP